jgi:hypothetical protein
MSAIADGKTHIYTLQQNPPRSAGHAWLHDVEHEADLQCMDYRFESLFLVCRHPDFLCKAVHRVVAM